MPGPYRVEQLAAAAEVSVDTVRYYQAKGLLPPPRREGRIAWYGAEHRARLMRIRELAAGGLTLATIGRVLSGDLDAADEALALAVASSTETPPGDAGEQFGLEELARRSGIPLPLLEAVAREGLLIARQGTFTEADVTAAAAGLRLLEAGLPLADLLELARQHTAAMREIAERAVQMFDAYVRQPLRESSAPASELVAAFETMLPATVSLVAYHFERVLLSVALEHIEKVGDSAELEAVRSSS